MPKTTKEPKGRRRPDSGTNWRSRITGHGEADPTTLLPHPQNWRRHGAQQRAGLTAVLDRVGWVQDVIVNRRTGRLVDGHLRVALACDRADPVIPVVYVDLEEDEEAFVLSTLDPLAAMAQADAEALTALLRSVGEEADDAVGNLLTQIAADAGAGVEELRTGLTDPDDAPLLPPTPVTRPGDLWELDGHRFLCGDATCPADADGVLNGERATWIWTDPPYGVAYQGRTRDRLTLENDAAEGRRALLDAAFQVADERLTKGAPIYVAHSAGPLALTFGAAFQAAGWQLH